MTTDTPTGVLRREHQLILAVLGVFERLLDRGSQSKTLDLEAVEACAVFFRLFADRCHHGKEEDLLFPALEAVGMHRDGGPIAVMLHEHRLGRALVSSMHDNLPAARQGVPQAVSDLVQAGRQFVELLSNHIAKEDNVLFMMADRMISGPVCGKLCADYSEVCARQFDGQSKQQLEDMARELLSRYGESPA